MWFSFIGIWQYHVIICWRQKVILSDGSEALLKGVSPKEVDSIRAGASLESSIYDRLITLLSDKENQKEIVDNYPDTSLRRRNSGYAIDELLHSDLF